MINEQQKKEFWKILELLEKLEILDHLIIIGSWAEYIYFEAQIFDSYLPFIRTQDLDFLIKNKSKPKKSINIIKEFENLGYNWDSSINGLEVLRNDIFEIQFMLRELGKGNLKPVKYKPFNMNLEEIRDLNIIVNNVIRVEIFDKKINVPKPTVYIIQKMSINYKRGIKKEKDRDSILNLYELIAENEKQYKDFINIFKYLKGKQKQRVIEFCNENLIEIPE